MDTKRGVATGAIVAVIVFLLQWVASDILDNQTYFSPHEVVNELFGTSTETTEHTDTSADTEEVYVPADEDNYEVYTIRVSSANAERVLVLPMMF